MSKIAFFCIPASGHTNPTLAVVRALTQAGAFLVGGCCGTTPEYIAALRAALAEQ